MEDTRSKACEALRLHHEKNLKERVWMNYYFYPEKMTKVVYFLIPKTILLIDKVKRQCLALDHSNMAQSGATVISAHYGEEGK